MDGILRALRTNLNEGLVEEEIVDSVFDGKAPDYYTQLIDKIIGDKLASRSKKGYKHYWGDSILLTVQGIEFIDNGGYAQEADRRSVEMEAKLDRERLEVEKLTAEVIDLRNRLFDYESTKRRTIRSEWIAWMSVIVALGTFVYQFLSKR